VLELKDMRRCTRCKIEKPLNDFYRYKCRASYYAKCKRCCGEEVSAYARKPGSYAFWRRRRERALRRGISFELTQADYKILYKEKKCYYCEKNSKELTVDRVNNNEGYTRRNCVVACRKCNDKKRTVILADFAWLRKLMKKIENHQRRSVLGIDGGKISGERSCL
jgi:hypothetical protein